MMGNSRILLVDDDGELRSVMAAFLSSRGHGVLEAASGVEGFLLEVEDNGVGFPPGYDISRASARGLRLVQALADKEEARFERVSIGQGSLLRLHLPSETARP